MGFRMRCPKCLAADVDTPTEHSSGPPEPPRGDNLDDTVWAWIETTAAGEEDAERIFDSWVEWRWGR